MTVPFNPVDSGDPTCLSNAKVLTSFSVFSNFDLQNDCSSSSDHSSGANEKKIMRQIVQDHDIHSKNMRTDNLSYTVFMI